MKSIAIQNESARLWADRADKYINLRLSIKPEIPDCDIYRENPEECHVAEEAYADEYNNYRDCFDEWRKLTDEGVAALWAEFKDEWRQEKLRRVFAIKFDDLLDPDPALSAMRYFSEEAQERNRQASQRIARRGIR